ncbi:MAG: exodeoxyribonuclease V subunit gamma, partial [Ilumatobacteraceae bacterium]
MLTVHRAERADHLVEALASLLATPPDDPFAAEIVAVPTRGVERWLAQRLSNVLGVSPGRTDGICANVEFPFPGRLVGRATQAATGIDPGTDPWASARAAWPLLDVIDEHIDEPWMAVLSGHIGGSDQDDDRRARRFGTARHIADLFDRYSVHRPTMVTGWAAGADVDGHGNPLSQDVVWQAVLWRHLRERLGVPSPAERLGPVAERIRAEPQLIDLPGRCSLFGLTRLAPSMLHTLDAIAASRDVHLFLLHPSPALWEHVAASPSPSAAAANPLLETWGRDAREMQLAIAASVGLHADEHHAGGTLERHLLARLQADIRANARPPGAAVQGAADDRMLLDTDDDSVQVHSCHGRSRQVEVLRDAILHLFANDNTLEPRDVIVMCPDIETFAPYIQATFGVGDDASGGPALDRDAPPFQVRLADRAVRQTNPVLAAVSDLLALTPTRVTASQLIDFAGLEPVRRRFHLDDDDLARADEWVSSAGVRWGLDAAHREPFQLQRVGENTWNAGLDRLLLGVSMTEDDQPLIGDVLPLDDVDSGDIELAGRVAELVARVHTAIDALTPRQTVQSWATTIAATTDALMACRPVDSWQRAELATLLEEIVEESGATTTQLSLPELRALLGDRLRGRPGRANFRTGHLTICTLVPMRSVPHRVVCLLGLDDGAFPRHGAPDGDDLVERTRQVGDHDVRSEDRQLLLDALLAATDHVVITFSGRDERSNVALPPSVPIGELLDVIDATVRCQAGAAREQIVVKHPLQPFDRRNFEPGQLLGRGPWSFDANALAGARALTGPRHPAAPFLTAPLDTLATLTTRVIELDDLVRFVQHPVRAFLRQRLGISLSDIDDELEDAIPVQLDALERWGVGQRLLDARLRGSSWERAIGAERARGLLPPGALGEQVVDGVRSTVDAVHAGAVAARAGAPVESVDVSIDLGPAGIVAGTVTDVYGDVLVTASFSRLGPKHRLAAWVRFLVLNAANPSHSFRAITIGRGKRSNIAGVARLTTITTERAVEHLRTLLDLHARGMREPLPLYCDTSAALAGTGNARNEWETDQSFDREDRDPAHVLVLGPGVSFAQLLDERPRADEEGAPWAADESTRVGRYAHRLWAGLLA